MAGVAAFLSVQCKAVTPAPKLLAVIGAAAILAGAASLAGGATLASKTAGGMAAGSAATFSERFGPVEADCSARSWPYFGSECLRMADGSRVRPARVIPLH